MKKTSKFSFGSFLRRSSVPIMFIIICAFCIPLSGLSPSYLINEIVTRMGRNAFLIISLLIPIMAGMGLNFGMTLGAMAGEIGLILASDWQIIGIPGMVLAMILSIISTIVTCLPLCARATDSSHPTSPPPMTTTFCPTSCSFSRTGIARETIGLSLPGTGMTIGSPWIRC